MAPHVDLFRTRLLPALVATLGVSLIAVGVLSYVTGGSGDDGSTRSTIRPSGSLTADVPGAPGASLDPSPGGSMEGSPGATAAPWASPSSVPNPTLGPGGPPAASPTASTSPSASGPPPSDAPATPSVEPGGTLAASASPGTAAATPEPTSAPTASARPSTERRFATRVVIPALGIDLPVIEPPGGPTTYPVCNVAMYIQTLSQPGEAGATYLYAHARKGMFLPILEASLVDNGRGMIGMLVEVYTSDNMQFRYEIYQVRRHQLSLDDALAAKSETLWLQTSEGPRGTPGKTQVIARPIGSGPADPEEANPPANPVVCG
jgi:hypothetical protein